MSKAERDLEGIKRNNERDEYLLQLMYDEWDNGACCPGCMFGSNYTRITERIRRRTEFAKVLEQRIATGYASKPKSVSLVQFLLHRLGSLLVPKDEGGT